MLLCLLKVLFILKGGEGNLLIYNNNNNNGLLICILLLIYTCSIVFHVKLICNECLVGCIIFFEWGHKLMHLMSFWLPIDIPVKVTEYLLSC